MLIESAPEEDRRVEQHYGYLKTHLESGAVLLAGRTLNTNPTSFGIVIFRAADEVEASRFMENDPAVCCGVVHATLFPYRVALCSSALSRTGEGNGSSSC